MAGCGLIKDQKKRYFELNQEIYAECCGLIKDQKKRY